jgi:menaquinone-9 beta-reductase
MAERMHDVVIVGGRCAGAALAAYLARDGASVVVLDADTVGTDQVLSTHTIHPSGMDVLDELGVGASVRQSAPPARTLRLQFDHAYLDVEPPKGRDECCPRRKRLDRLLQEAASAAGADLRDRTRVSCLIHDKDRVVGVRAEREGRTVELRAGLIVGADGRRSTVAKLCGAEEYLGYDWQRGAYWAYWDPPAIWESSEYPYDFLLRFVGQARRLIFTTDHGQLLLGTMPPIVDARRWRTADHKASYLEDLRSDPVFAPLVQGALAGPVIGTVNERFFFRRAAGPGWALVGDAGHHKDPLIGWGIAEALVQAKHLAAAVRAGSHTALERYWRQRDVDALPRFRLGEERGTPGPMNPVLAVALGRVPEVPGLAQQMFRETEYDVNPYELMPVQKVARWTLSAALRGRPGLIVDFVRMGMRARAVQQEVAARRRFLSAVDGAVRRAPSGGSS